MNKITYLLGAGASANTIPTVADMPIRLSEFEFYINEIVRNFQSDNLDNFYPHGVKNNLKLIYDILSDIKWLQIEANNHQTIDTLAKRYFLMEDFDSLNRLKRVLILYFTAEQLTQIDELAFKNIHGDKCFQKRDEKRYDSLIASIATKTKSGVSLPGNIKILSWNYDLQFELAASKYFGHPGINKLKENLQILPNTCTYDVMSGAILDLSKFGLVRLNGCAIWDSNIMFKAEEKVSTLFDKPDEDSPFIRFVKIIEKYAELFPDNALKPDNCLRCFNFSWETEKDFPYKYLGHNNNIEAAISIAEQTEVLIIIGYSFPVFNRDLDRVLINAMGKRLKKVYIQDKYPEKIQGIITNAFERLQGPFSLDKPKVEFALESSLDQFVHPYEL